MCHSAVTPIFDPYLCNSQTLLLFIFLPYGQHAGVGAPQLGLMAATAPEIIKK